MRRFFVRSAKNAGTVSARVRMDAGNACVPCRPPLFTEGSGKGNLRLLLETKKKLRQFPAGAFLCVC